MRACRECRSRSCRCSGQRWPPQPSIWWPGGSTPRSHHTSCRHQVCPQYTPLPPHLIPPPGVFTVSPALPTSHAAARCVYSVSTPLLYPAFDPARQRQASDGDASSADGASCTTNACDRLAVSSRPHSMCPWCYDAASARTQHMQTCRVLPSRIRHLRNQDGTMRAMQPSRHCLSNHSSPNRGIELSRGEVAPR